MSSTRASCLTQFRPPVTLTAIGFYACPGYHRASTCFRRLQIRPAFWGVDKGWQRVRLQGQPFQMLVMLLERPGQLVTRQEICQKLSSTDTFVDFDHSLGTAINKIREVLNDSAAEPRFVETIPRRGYRFIAPVTAVALDPPPVPQEPVPPSAPPAELVKAPLRGRHFLSVVGSVSLQHFWSLHSSRGISTVGDNG